MQILTAKFSNKDRIIVASQLQEALDDAVKVINYTDRFVSQDSNLAPDARRWFNPFIHGYNTLLEYVNRIYLYLDKNLNKVRVEYKEIPKLRKIFWKVIQLEDEKVIFEGDDEEKMMDFCNENYCVVTNPMNMDTFYREGLWYRLPEIPDNIREQFALPPKQVKSNH